MLHYNTITPDRLLLTGAGDKVNTLSLFSLFDFRFAKWRNLADQYQLSFDRFQNFYDLIKDTSYPRAVLNDFKDYNQFAFDYYQKLSGCASFLEFEEDINNRIRLKKTFFCRWRLCPVCQWRRRLVNTFNFYQKVLELQKNHDFKFLFLTLNIQNFPLERVSEALEILHKAYRRLFGIDGGKQKKYYPANLFYDGDRSWVYGSVRSTEVTRHWRDQAWDCNVHLHALLCVSSEYGSKYYLDNKQLEWVYAWRSALQKIGFDNGGHNPTAFVELIRPKKTTSINILLDDDLKDNSLLWAVREVFKYSCKPNELDQTNKDYLIEITQADNYLLDLFGFDFSYSRFFRGISTVLYLSDLYFQLKNKHLLQSYGVFRNLIKDSDPDSSDFLHDLNNNKFDADNIINKKFFMWYKFVDDLIFYPDYVEVGYNRNIVYY